MDILYSLFFGAGIAAYIYSRMGRRIGYGNSQNVVTVVGVVFVIATLVFFTVLHFIIHV